MSITPVTSFRNIALGVVALLLAIPLLYAQRSPPSNRGDPAPKSTLVQHSPTLVYRAYHGSIRHLDAHPVEQPGTARRDSDGHKQVILHRDADVHIHHPQHWHGFVYGTWRHGLRVGCVQVFVNETPYYYDEGIFYKQAGADYQTVYPPVGAVVPRVPDGAMAIAAGNLVYYYAGGAFYVQQGDGFAIAPPPLGVIVPELPPGAVQVAVSNGVAYQFNGLYYQPVFVNGATQYRTFIV